MPRRLWRLLREPRVVTALSGLIWVLCTLVGTAALWLPPNTVTSEISTPLTWVWGLLLLFGGLMGLVGCWVLPQPWWRDLEQIAVISASFGVLMYGSIICYLQAVSTSGGSRYVQIGIIAIALVTLCKRWVEIDDPDRSLLRWRQAHGDA